MLSDEETDSFNVMVESNDGSLYIPTPQRKVIKSISVPLNCYEKHRQDCCQWWIQNF